MKIFTRIYNIKCVLILLGSILLLNPAVADDSDININDEIRLCIDELNTKNLGLCLQKVKETCVTQYLYSQCNYQIAIRVYDYYLEIMAGDEKAIDAYNEISEVISARCGVLEEPETDRTASEAVFSQ